MTPTPQPRDDETTGLPRLEPLTDPDAFNYCQSLNCDGPLHPASHVLVFDIGSVFEQRRLLCNSAAAVLNRWADRDGEGNK